MPGQLVWTCLMELLGLVAWQAQLTPTLDMQRLLGRLKQETKVWCAARCSQLRWEEDVVESAAGPPQEELPCLEDGNALLRLNLESPSRARGVGRAPRCPAWPLLKDGPCGPGKARRCLAPKGLTSISCLLGQAAGLEGHFKSPAGGSYAAHPNCISESPTAWNLTNCTGLACLCR